MANISKGHFSNAGQVISGTFNNHGVSLAGTIHGNVYIGGRGSEAKEAECKTALFLTNPVDDRGDVATAKPRLLPKACQWIRDHIVFKSWIDNTTECQLLWIAGGSGMGKTMMSLFLLKEFETNPAYAQDSTLLYYFVDTRNEKRNTAVAILRGLIFVLLRTRPSLISHLMTDFEYQRDALFGPNSLEALWRIFESMMRDPATGRVICLIDGLDECREDSLKPLVRKISDFFFEQQNLRQLIMQNNIRPGTINSIAWLKLVLVSRESPDCIRENLSGFPLVKLGAAPKKEANMAKPKAGARRPSIRSGQKLSAIARLALQKKRLEQSNGHHAASAGNEAGAPNGSAGTIESLQGDMAALRVSSDPSQQYCDGEMGRNESARNPSGAKESEEYVFDDPVEEDEETAKDNELTEEYPDNIEAVDDEEGDAANASLPLGFYIEDKLSDLAKEKGYTDTLIASVANSLGSKGDGTFLWVDLAIWELRQYAAEHAQQVAELLLPEVNDMYCRILHQIPPNNLQLAVATLRWVVAARRPLTIHELSVALQMMGFSSYNPIEMTGQGIAACGPLLNVSKDMLVHITHTSVKDILTAKSGPLWSDAGLHHFHVNVEDMDSDIAAYCIAYLEQGCLIQGSVSKLEDEASFNQHVVQFPLFSYALLFWPDHLRSATRPRINLSSPFFTKKSVIRKHWWLSYYSATTQKGSFWAPRDFSLVHLAAYLNLPFLAFQLEQSGELAQKLNSQDSHGTTPLAHAAINGGMSMVVFLIQRNALQECMGESVFELACRKGQLEIVEYLLNLGYDPNMRARDIGFMESLGKSTRWIHGIVSEGMLLDIDHWRLIVRDIGTGGTPLHSACLSGHLAVARLLLSRGANVHMATTKKWTALHGASWTGQAECVKLLLEKGANPLEVTDFGWNSMHCAASRGKTALVSLFLDMGIHVDTPTSKLKSSLHLAAYSGVAATIKVLVAAGAAVDLQSHKGETPLHLATRATKPEAVETLLAGGANRLMINKNGLTAADTIRMIKGTLSEDNQEILRILETFGAPGYMPWKPKEDKKATVGGQGKTSNHAAGGTASFQANFQFTAQQSSSYHAPPQPPGEIRQSHTMPTTSAPQLFPQATGQPYGQPPPPYSQYGTPSAGAASPSPYPYGKTRHASIPQITHQANEPQSFGTLVASPSPATNHTHLPHAPGVPVQPDFTAMTPTMTQHQTGPAPIQQSVLDQQILTTQRPPLQNNATFGPPASFAAHTIPAAHPPLHGPVGSQVTGVQYQASGHTAPQMSVATNEHTSAQQSQQWSPPTGQPLWQGAALQTGPHATGIGPTAPPPPPPPPSVPHNPGAYPQLPAQPQPPPQVTGYPQPILTYPGQGQAWQNPSHPGQQGVPQPFPGMPGPQGYLTVGYGAAGPSGGFSAGMQFGQPPLVGQHSLPKKRSILNLGGLLG